METIKKNRQEHMELRDHIDAIATTAKLLGYTVSGHFDEDVTYFTINKKGEIIPFISFLIIYKRINPKDDVKLETTHNGTVTTLENISHQIKINHLKDLLQNL